MRSSSVNGHFYDGISICAARDSRMEPSVHSCAAYSAPCSFAASTHDLHCNRLRASESGSKRFMEHDCRTCGDEPGSSSCCRDADRAWRARSRSGTVYGVGLARPQGSDLEGEVVYTHFYDKQVGRCARNGPYSRGNSSSEVSAAAKRIPGARTWSRSKWRRARVGTEVLLHLFHAFGMMRWVTQ